MIEERPGAATRAIAGAIAGLRFRHGPYSRLFWRLFWLAALWRRAPDLVRGWIAEESEARRPFLWIAVFYGAGVLLYFAAEAEPAMWAPLLALSLFAGAAAFARRRGAINAYRCLVACAALFAGFATATIKTRVATAPIIARTLTTQVVAFVEAIDIRENGARLVLRPVSMEGAPSPPVRIRVTSRTRPDFEAGATIAATMRLLPPPRAAKPGGYDFSRDAFFQHLGAVGSISGKIRLADRATVGWIAELNAAIDRARNNLTQRIIDVVGGAHGPVAAALVTGKRGQISEETNEALRGAGIYHVVSISGLHMVLAAGLFLWSLRSVLALWPAVAMMRPIKTWSALFAMTGAIAYDLFSGSEVATERSLAMVLILLGAVVIGRPAFSMRNLALAALVVLALEPHTLLGPSFQMSFAAVAAMIAAFERRIRPAGVGMAAGDVERDRRATAWGRIRVVFVASVVTTMVASLATDPYASFHFHRISPFGLIGNLLTLPLVEFIVMPAAVLGVLAYPFGLDGVVWWGMGQGAWFMMEIARWVSSLDGAVLAMPAFGAGALLLMTLGLVWTALWQTPLRWIGAAPFIFGVGLAATAAQPDVLIDAQGRSVAYRQDNGRLAVLNARANPFGVSQWLSADADPRKPVDRFLAGNGLCDAKGCTGVLRDGRIIALVLEREAMAHDCGRADIVVTPLFAESLCVGPELLIDGGHLARYGATQLTLSAEGGLRQRVGRPHRYDRPWSRAPSGSASAAAMGWTAPSASNPSASTPSVSAAGAGPTGRMEPD